MENLKIEITITNQEGKSVKASINYDGYFILKQKEVITFISTK